MNYPGNNQQGQYGLKTRDGVNEVLLIPEAALIAVKDMDAMVVGKRKIQQSQVPENC